jgi:serine/threonine protein kinase
VDSLVSTILGGKYEIQAEIGRGGMGIVYRGYDVMLRRLVAVKVLPLEYTFDQQFVDRFRQEAITSAGLHHPGIVTIYDVGQQAPWHYIVMQLLGGMTLDQWLLRTGPLPIPKIVQIVQQLGAALDYAHRAAVVHRDIKPSNIMIGPDGHATLMDFGLVHAGEGSRLTRSGVVLGTPEYMAPEQVLGEPVDGRTDLYSLGVVIYRMLVGQTPFVRSTSLATAHAQVYDPPPSLRILRSDLPKSIEAVVLKALAKRPDDRYQLGAKLSADLDLAALGKMPPGLKGTGLPRPVKNDTKAPRVGLSKNPRSPMPEVQQEQSSSPKPPLRSAIPASDAATVVLKSPSTPTIPSPPENTVVISRQPDQIRAPMVDNLIPQQLQTVVEDEPAPHTQQTIRAESGAPPDDADAGLLPQAVSTNLLSVSEPGRESVETSSVVMKERPLVLAPDRSKGDRLVWMPVWALFVVMILMVIQGGRADRAPVALAPTPTVLTDPAAEQVSAQQTSDQATRTAIAQAATSTANAVSTVTAEAALSFIHATRTAAAHAVATEVAATVTAASARATRTAEVRDVSTEVAAIKANAAAQNTSTAATAVAAVRATAAVQSTRAAAATAVAQATRVRLAAAATALAKIPRATVWANQDWQNSGISVQAGDTLRIRYFSGAWSSWENSLGPPASSGHSYGIMPTVSWTGLIGRIENGPPFAIGSEARVAARSSGRLFLRINDTDTRDNTGSIVVLIEVIRSSR